MDKADRLERSPKLEISGFPDALRRRFKAATALQGKSMSEMAVDLIEAWCEQQENQRAAPGRRAERNRR
jgi:hypothetical protein